MTYAGAIKIDLSPKTLHFCVLHEYEIGEEIFMTFAAFKSSPDKIGRINCKPAFTKKLPSLFRISYYKMQTFSVSRECTHTISDTYFSRCARYKWNVIQMIKYANKCPAKFQISLPNIHNWNYTVTKYILTISPYSNYSDNQHISFSIKESWVHDATICIKQEWQCLCSRGHRD